MESTIIKTKVDYIRMINKLSILAFTALISGCATIISGSGPQAVTIATDPEGADVSIVSNVSGDIISKFKSPSTIMLERSYGAFQRASYNVLISSSGYMKEETSIMSDTNWWYLGNVLFGGLIGLTVDVCSGAMFSLDNKPIKLKLYPNNLEGRIAKSREKYDGTAMFRSGDYDSAITTTTAAISLYPENFDALYIRGMSYAATRKESKALIDFNRAISINPEDPKVYYERAMVFINLNSKEKATSDMLIACNKGLEKACKFQY